MTEIPEHLLKRSKAAKGGKSGDDAGDSGDAGTAVESTAAAAAPVAAGPAALAEAAAAIPADKPKAAAPPDPSYIAAAKRRKKMPMWAMGLVAALPIWAISYAGTMQQQEVEDLLYIDAELAYTQDGGCAGCHGAGGGGGQGYAFTDGEIMATFPDPIDHMVHVARGSSAIQDQAYGDPDRPGGARVAGARNSGAMPSQLAGLTQTQLELVVFHERIVLGGDDASTPANEAWIESLREQIETEGSAIDLELLLACANPEQTPGATGAGAPEGAECPGGHAEDDGELAAEE